MQILPTSTFTDKAPSTPLPSDQDARFLFDNFDTIKDGSAKTQAADLLDRYSKAKAAAGLKPFQPSPDDVQAQHAKLEGLYGGLDAVDAQLPAEKKDAVLLALRSATDPQEAKARMVNQLFVAQANPDPQLQAQIDSNWPAVRAQVAQGFGQDGKTISDVALYGVIGAHVKQLQAERGMAAGLSQHVQQAALEGDSDWLKNYREFMGSSPDGYDPTHADQYRQIAEASFNAVADKAHLLGPAVRTVADIMQRGKGDPNILETDEARQLEDKAVDALAGFSPQDRAMAIQLAAQRVNRLTGEQDRGALEKAGTSFARGVVGVTNSLKNVYAQLTELGSGTNDPQSEERRQIRSQLMNAYFQTADPVSAKNIAVKGLYNVAAMLPQIAMVASPEVGIPILMASNTDTRARALKAQGVPDTEANAVGLVQGSLDTALNFVTANMVFGKIPGGMLGTVATTGTQLATRIIKTAGIEVGTLTAATVAQQVSPLIVQEMAAQLSKDVPHIDWAAQTAGLKHALPEVIATLAPLILIGTGTATFREVGKFNGYTADVTNLKAVGFDAATAERLSAIPDVSERIATIQKEFPNAKQRTPEQAQAVDQLNQHAANANQGDAQITPMENNDQAAGSGFDKQQTTLANLIGQQARYEGYSGKVIRDEDGNFVLLREAVQKGQPNQIEIADTGKDPAKLASDVGIVPEGGWKSGPLKAGYRVTDGQGNLIDYASTPEEAQRLADRHNSKQPVPVTDANPLPASVDIDSIKPLVASTESGRSNLALGITGNDLASAAILKAWAGLSTGRRQFLNLVKTRDAKNEWATEYGAQDNKADIYARRQATGIADDLARVMGREVGTRSTKDEEALTFMVESKRSRQQLQNWRDELEATRDPEQAESVGRAKRAIDRALTHFDQLAAVASKYEAVHDQQLTQELAMGLRVQRRQGYVRQMHEMEDGVDLPFMGGKGTGAGTSFKNARVFDNYVESIVAGYKPKTLNAVTLMEGRLSSGQKNINRQLWATAGRTIIDPSTAMPLVTDMEHTTRPFTEPANPDKANPGTVERPAEPDQIPQVTPPLGYEPRQIGNQTIAVHKGYTGLFDALMQPSAVQNSTVGRAALQAAALAKSTMLFFDTFHLGRLAYHQLALRGSASYEKGLLMLDHNLPEIERMIARKEIDLPPAFATTLLEHKRNLDLLLDKGFNVAAIGDNMHADLIHSLPLIGRYNHFLFDKFQRGGMVETGLLEMERIKQQMPEAKPSDVAAQVASDLNRRFGNLGKQSWLKSRTYQDIARLVFLAPGWNEGLLRSEIGAASQIGQTVKEAVVNRRFVAGTLERNIGALVVGQFMANQIINYITRGHPTWENPEEGAGAKLSAWIPDVFGHGPGLFLNPFSLSAEITGQYIEAMERGQGPISAAVTVGSYKLGPAGRALDILRTKTDQGKPIFNDLDLAKHIGKALLPLPIQTDTLSRAARSLNSGEVTESFPGQIEKQALATVGIKAQSAPSALQRIGRLASEFKQAAGKKTDIIAGESDYSPLRHSLATGNKQDVAEAMAELLRKRTPAEIQAYFSNSVNRPFTGSKAMEGQFMKSLNTEERKTYDKARDARKEMAKAAMEALRATPVHDLSEDGSDQPGDGANAKKVSH